MYLSNISFNPINKLNFPRIDKEAADTLGKPVSHLELEQALQSMHNGKLAGSNSFLVELLKNK